MKNLKIILAMATLLLVTSKANAAQMTAGLLTLGDSRPNTATTHNFTFTQTTGATVKTITFEYCATASGACGTNTVSAPGVTVIANETLVGDDWTAAFASQKITATTADVNGQFLPAGSYSITFNAVTNGQLSDACDGNTTDGTNTCFVRVTDYALNGTDVVDQTVLTYTLLDAVVVTAKVDPTFTFVVSAVNSNAVHNDITASVTSTSNSLPFGSLQAGTPKYAGHQLNVTTNTQGGYTVTTKLATQLTGIYPANNIDSFVAPWNTATTWTEPTGNVPSANTGWFGANTTDTDVADWDGDTTELFGGVDNTTPVTVMRSTISDNGAIPVYVTYALEANVYQPSDQYNGVLIYNALPTY